MTRVWDANWFGSTKTLDVHIRTLRKKVGDDSAHPASSRQCAEWASGCSTQEGDSP